MSDDGKIESKEIEYEGIIFNFMSIDEIKEGLDGISIVKENYKIVKVGEAHSRWWYNAKKKWVLNEDNELKDNESKKTYSRFCVYIKFFEADNKKYGITVGKTNWENHDIDVNNDVFEKAENDLKADKSKLKGGIDEHRTLFSRKIMSDNEWIWSQEVIIIRIESKNNEFDDESKALLIERHIGNKFGLFDS